MNGLAPLHPEDSRFLEPASRPPAATAGRVLFVDDEEDARDLVGLALRQRGFSVHTADSAEAALELLEHHEFDVVLTDVRLGEMDGIALCEEIAQRDESLPVIVVTAFGQIDLAVAAIRASADDFVTKPFRLEQLELMLERAVRDHRLHAAVAQLTAELADVSPERELLGDTREMRDLRQLIEQVAHTSTTVLITGESGTGKELVARAIHSASPRDGDFIAINCAAMPASLLESELFGHVKGAFTDARGTRKGLICQAEGGTLFLDEIGEMPPEMQVKLLRVLQERRVRPVGSDEEIAFDTRIIAATNCDLGLAVSEGRFREDLYYRINIVPIKVPPLRERRDDILTLAQRFVERNARRMGKRVVGISVPVAAKLLEYDWPGNIRELENAVACAVTLTRYREIMAEDLPDRIRDRAACEGIVPPRAPGEPMPTLEEVERKYVLRVLRTVDGNRTQAARILGVNRRTLYRRLARLGISGESIPAGPTT
ncbi:MAG TPA: sigma-54 dependent transcriptional regulator [Kofleriaceae bacterium]|nr:sigma-54 dependent transcriptional regulator [Kofleriaceae bacterium]